MNLARALLAVLLVLIGGNLQAATLVTRFTGSIAEIVFNDNQILGDLQLGVSISGHFTFDDDPAASFGNDRFAAEISLSFPGRTLAVESNHNYIRARNDVNHWELGTIDEFMHGFDSVGPDSAPGPYYVYALTVRFIDIDATAFGDAPSLPVVLDMSDYETASWSITGVDLATRTQRFSVAGTITGISVVPEPHTLALATITSAIVLQRRLRRSRPVDCNATHRR